MTVQLITKSDAVYKICAEAAQSKRITRKRLYVLEIADGLDNQAEFLRKITHRAVVNGKIEIVP